MMTAPHERRRHTRYQLTPPLRGRASIDLFGQCDAQLIDLSIEGAQMILELGTPDALARFLGLKEKAINCAFPRSGGVPWKFVLLHTRMTTVSEDDAATGKCVIAGRFVAVPNFTAADMEQMVTARLAVAI